MTQLPLVTNQKRRNSAVRGDGGHFVMLLFCFYYDYVSLKGRGRKINT